MSVTPNLTSTLGAAPMLPPTPPVTPPAALTGNTTTGPATPVSANRGLLPNAAPVGPALMQTSAPVATPMSMGPRPMFMPAPVPTQALAPSVTWMPVLKPVQTQMVTPMASATAPAATASAQAAPAPATPQAAPAPAGQPEEMPDLAEGDMTGELPAEAAPTAHANARTTAATAEQAAAETTAQTPAQRTGKQVGDFVTQILEDNPGLQEQVDKLNPESFLQDPNRLGQNVHDFLHSFTRFVPHQVDDFAISKLDPDIQSMAKKFAQWVRSDNPSGLTGGSAAQAGQTSAETSSPTTKKARPMSEAGSDPMAEGPSAPEPEVEEAPAKKASWRERLHRKEAAEPEVGLDAPKKLSNHETAGADDPMSDLLGGAKESPSNELDGPGGHGPESDPPDLESALADKPGKSAADKLDLDA